MGKYRKIPALIVIALIFYLTFQTPSQTMRMSEGFRAWLANKLGIVMGSSDVRSNAHLPEYFALGFTLCLWLGWKKSLWVGSLIGLIDETIKIILPTRHFDLIDLIKDIIGVAAGILVYQLLQKLIRRIKNNGD